MTKCFACNRKLGAAPALVEAMDEQSMYVGRECFRLIKAAGAAGYQPPMGGPRLYLMGLGWSKGKAIDNARPPVVIMSA